MRRPKAGLCILFLGLTSALFSVSGLVDCVAAQDFSPSFAPVILNDPFPIAGGRFGAGVAFVGDIDGDGIPDLAVSAPNNGGGRAYVFSGRDQRLLLTFIPGGSFTAIAGVGDVNGDGVPDIFVGAVGGYIFSGINGALIGPADSWVVFRKNRRVGDLTGDGIDEFFRLGYIYNGADATVLAGPIVSGDPTVCAYDATTLGDVNHDGIPEFAIGSASGAPGCGVGVNGTLVSVFSGREALTDPAGALLYRILIPNDTYGELATAGDMNGDGVLDLLVAHGAYPHGDIFCDQGGPGKLSIFNGKDGTLLFSIDNPVPVPRSFFGFASALADGIDVNADGIADFLVGAPGGDGSEGGCVNNTGQVVLFLSGPEVLRVAIDIKPRSFPNSINLGSGGTVPVAILSTATFDATTVDPTTVTLASAPVRLKGKGTPMASSEDLNGDGLPDLVVHVSTDALVLSEADTEAVLEGKTFDGKAIQGTDSVRIVPD